MFQSAPVLKTEDALLLKRASDTNTLFNPGKLSDCPVCDDKPNKRLANECLNSWTVASHGKPNKKACEASSDPNKLFICMEQKMGDVS